MRNNYLGNKSPAQRPDDRANRAVKDEQTPNQVLENKRSSNNESNDYYSTKEKKSQLSLSDNVKTILGVKEQDDWIYNLNIGNVMHLLPMSLEELNLHIDNSHELSRDAMLEKIILLSVSYFCVGTELRFLSNTFSKDQQDDGETNNYSLKDSEMWHAMSLETCGTFLPSECPLVSHIIMSYQKHHSPAMTTIPENETLEEPVTILRPLNSVKVD